MNGKQPYYLIKDQSNYIDTKVRSINSIENTTYTSYEKCSIDYLYANSVGNTNLFQKHPGCKKRSGQELKKGQDEKDLKSKWAAKAGVLQSNE